MKDEEMIGKKFHKLTVISLDSIVPVKGYRKFQCLCDCGKYKIMYKHALTSGDSKTCGCSRDDRSNNKPRKDIKMDGESGFNYMLSTYKRNARKRGYSFELTREEFRILTKQKCHYCGIEPLREVKYSGKKNTPPYICNGIDRYYNDQGYTIENSVPCCTQCNVAKASFAPEEFLKWIVRVYGFSKIPFHTPSGPSVMIDIDDTLICWSTPEGHEDKKIPIDCDGIVSYRVPNPHNIELLKQMYETGHVVILWSGSGVRWCKAVVKALDLEKYIHGSISKPSIFIDDIADPAKWMGKHGYFDIDGKSFGHQALFDKSQK